MNKFKNFLIDMEKLRDRSELRAFFNTLVFYDCFNHKKNDECIDFYFDDELIASFSEDPQNGIDYINYQKELFNEIKDLNDKIYLTRQEIEEFNYLVTNYFLSKYITNNFKNIYGVEFENHGLIGGNQ